MTLLAIWPKRSAHAWLAMWAATAVAATVTALIPGLAVDARAFIGATFAEHDATPRAAVALWTNNVQVALLPLIGALCARYGALARRFWDVLLAFSVTLNVALVGFAVGGYGLWRSLPWLPHLPLEWAGIAVTVGAYLTLRRASHATVAVFAGAAVASASLLAGAALLEVYAVPHR